MPPDAPIIVVSPRCRSSSVPDAAYYEFRAIDRPLDDRQMRELRAVSSRAVITPTSFTNEYNWADFKGSPEKWMEKYFDAFLYLANWGTRRLMLRIPRRLLDAKTAATFCVGDSASLTTSGDYVILSFESQIEDEDWVESEGWLASLIPLRSEILRGDLRCLYLAWLLCVQNGEIDDDEVEPTVPPNLRQLSASESSFADFLGIDGDLIEVAAKASLRSIEDSGTRKELESWVPSLPEDEKNTLLLRMLDDDPQLGTELRIRFATQARAGNQSKCDSKFEDRRTVAGLLSAAEALTKRKGAGPLKTLLPKRSVSKKNEPPSVKNTWMILRRRPRDVRLNDGNRNLERSNPRRLNELYRAT